MALLSTIRRVLFPILLATLSWAAPVAGQEPEPDPIEAEIERLVDAALEPDRLRFLFRAGGTWADLRGLVVLDARGPVPFERDFGFAVGAAAELRLSHHLSLQPEVLIVRRFARVGAEPPGARQSKLSSHYLELPLHVKWYPGGRDGPRGNFVVGPMPALLLGATREIRDGNRIEEPDIRELLADLDWSLSVGGGFEFSEAFANFTVDLRYVHGLTDMNAPGTEAAARWSTLQLLVGIAF